MLITGALGHIGSKLIHAIKPGQFDEVRLIDNMMTQRYASLFNLPEGVNFRFIEEDICAADLDKYFEGIDMVVHLAAVTDAAASYEKKGLVDNINYHGTEKVAQACIKNGCKLIFPSTTSVYGTQEEIVDEECSELKPQSPYAESKLKAEQLLIKFGKESDLKYIICRLGTIFGVSVGMRFHTAVNKFVWQACLGQPITVWRTAMNQKRPYLDLNDAVAAFLYVIKKDLFVNEIYNIVTGNFTVSEIIEIISGEVSDISINHVESKIMNQLSYAVQSDKFKKEGFKFQGDVKQGIKATINILSGARRKGG